MIEELMKVERLRLDRMEIELDETKSQKEAWREVNRGLGRLRESAKSLYGFENPFNQRIAVTSDETIVQATAGREALEENTELVVKQLAGRDRFLSNSLSKDFTAKAGSYRFIVDEREIDIAFRGGDLEDLSRAINDRSRGLVEAKVVRNAADTQIILIASTKNGAANTLQFEEAALEFAVDTGMLKAADDASRRFTLSPLSFRRWEKPLTDDVIRFADGNVAFPPGGEATLPIVPAVTPRENLQLEIKYRVISIPYDYTPPTPPPGPDKPGAGSVDYEGIEVFNTLSRVIVPEWNPPLPPEKRDDLTVFYIEGEDNRYPLPSVVEGNGTVTLEVRISDYLDTLDALHVRNNNTHREMEISSIRILDPDSRGDYTPVNPVEAASDAIVLMEGIQITRDSNTIDDLIPGVTLNLLKAGDEPVQIDIEPDRESIKETIIELVGNYNRLIAELNIISGRSEDVVDEITYFTDEERSSALTRVGLMQGDITLMQLRTRLQTVLINAYPTSEGNRLALLDQIGVSTNATRSGGAFDRTRLRGYLEIDEDRLDGALENMMPAIKELFGQDTDGDLVIDTGVAFSLDSYIRPYVETGGIMTMRIDNLDGRISRTTDRIETEQEKLAAKEQEYRREFGIMEGSLNTLEQSSQQIDNFNRSLDERR